MSTTPAPSAPTQASATSAATASARPDRGEYSEVTLVGRLGAVVPSVLPSGDEVVTCRVLIGRAPRDRGPSGRVSVDAIDVVAFTAATRRRLTALAEGDTVEVSGRLRRRFWRGSAGLASRTEVEARSVRRRPTP